MTLSIRGGAGHNIKSYCAQIIEFAYCFLQTFYRLGYLNVNILFQDNFTGIKTPVSIFNLVVINPLLLFTYVNFCYSGVYLC